MLKNKRKGGMNKVKFVTKKKYRPNNNLFIYQRK